MSTESRQPRSFASVRQLESMSGPYKANVQFFRGLDEIVGLADHMTRRGIVQSFLAGFGGLVVGCAVDEGEDLFGAFDGFVVLGDALSHTCTFGLCGHHVLFPRLCLRL